MRKTLATLGTTLLALLSIQVPAHARICGEASFYGGDGDGFAWQLMANGSVMNPNSMITAHRYLPFGTRLRVTNQDNGKSVVVRVTDRGPYYGGRVLDLSPRAFGSIASRSNGVANICYTRV